MHQMICAKEYYISLHWRTIQSHIHHLPIHKTRFSTGNLLTYVDLWFVFISALILTQVVIWIYCSKRRSFNSTVQKRTHTHTHSQDAAALKKSFYKNAAAIFHNCYYYYYYYYWYHHTFHFIHEGNDRWYTSMSSASLGDKG